MIENIFLLILALITGIAGNLIAGWFQQDIWNNFFSRNRLIITLLVAAVTIALSTIVQTEIDNTNKKSLPQSINVNGVNSGIIQQGEENSVIVVQPTATNTPFPTATPLAGLPAKEYETLILITNFHNTASINSEPHVKIRRRIQEAINQLNIPNTRIILEPTILVPEQQFEAEQLGRLYNATMIIWGEDTGVEIIVCFSLLKTTELFTKLSNLHESQRISLSLTKDVIEENEKSQLANPADYAKFITEDLPNQITFIALFAIGQIYAVHKNYSNATEIIETAINSVPEYSSVNGLADAYFRLGWLYQICECNLQKALVSYTKAINLGITNPRAYNNRGTAYMSLGYVISATVDYKQAISMDPDYANAYNGLGNSYLAQGDFELAIKEYTKAIEIDNKNYKPYFNRAEAIIMKSRLEQIFNGGTSISINSAIKDFDKVIEIDPSFVNAYFERGKLFYVIGNQEKALNDFNKVIEFEPQNTAALISRGILYAKQNRCREAIADLNTVINIENHENLGTIPLGQITKCRIELN